MASTNKTAHLGLSQWVSEDCPKMDDFNQDNQRLDAAVYQHTSNGNLHLSQEERAWISRPMAMGNYTGSGGMRKAISLGAVPKFVMVSAIDDSPYQYDPNLQYALQKFAVLFGEKGSNGIEITDDGFAVYQTTGGTAPGGTAMVLNQSGKSYWYMALL